MCLLRVISRGKLAAWLRLGKWETAWLRLQDTISNCVDDVAMQLNVSLHSSCCMGIHLDTNLSWSAHINSIISKANKQLYFLKQLKRAGVPCKQLHFYTAVTRPVLEYAAPAWHHLINRTQAKHLESVQKSI